MIYHECLLRVGVIGLNYKTADLAFREEFAKIAQKLEGEKTLFFKHPTVLLSTCNRTEIYFSAEDLVEAHGDLFAFFRKFLSPSFEHRLYTYFGVDCFFHLARVTSGLDSAILAETEIQRQVKLAYGRASNRLSFPSSMHYVFQKSLRVAKMIRNASHIKDSPTLYGTLWRIGENYFDIKKSRILLVGYSEITRGFATFLARRGVHGFCFVTRFWQEVVFEGAVMRGREILPHWDEFDWIICAAKSETYLIEGKATRPHLICDLSVPRNVDPALANSVSLWNIERIDQLIEKSQQRLVDLTRICEREAHHHVYRYARLYRAKIERQSQMFATFFKTQRDREPSGRG